jgi:hypothetical protein
MKRSTLIRRGIKKYKMLRESEKIEITKGEKSIIMLPIESLNPSGLKLKV